jgi:lipopolysaccharide export system protein LptA
MTRCALAVLGVALAFSALPDAAQAQQRGCDQVLQSDLRRVVDAAGQEILYYRNPVRMICPDGVQIEADSAVMNSATQTVELVGRVLYRDGDRQLTADWANYLSRTDELFARGSVVLTDLEDGSIISGDDFEYRRENEERPEARMIMRGERPHARLSPAAGPGATEAPTPVLVWARRMELLGESIFLAQTDVELQRGDMRGAGDAVRFDQAGGRMTLTGRAHVESEEYRLEGERIDASLANDVLEDVLSEREARLVADELTVRGERIRIGFVDGQPERIEAWNPAARNENGESDADAPAPRAVAISQDFQLRADSIDARSDGGRLRQVTAVGRAYGEREADTLAVNLPDVISRDWIQGDTIIGFFTQETNGVDLTTEEVVAIDTTGLPAIAATDTVGVDGPDSLANGPGERSDGAVLERVEVVGGTSDALSLYRTEAPEGGGRPSANFMRAKRIILFMTDGEVSRVEADGPIEGIYLDPDGNARPTTRIAS